jgi:mono/diheme cytochrome c family protein
MKKFLKIISGILLFIAIVTIGLFVFVNSTWDKKLDAPYPTITSSSDSTVIAQGKHLIYGPAHCATCHVPMDKLADLERGVEVPLSGGWELPIPPGIFRARNLTPDLETGIGKLTDAEVARVMREAVGHDGRFIFPFMPFQDMTDEDITAIISFLRSQAPIKNEIQPTEYSFLGKMVQATGLMKPIGPTGIPAKSIKKDSSIVYGSYLANSVANCKGCHTARDLKTGEITGIPLEGGYARPPDAISQGYAFFTPN